MGKIIIPKAVKRKKGYMYFIDKNGSIIQEKFIIRPPMMKIIKTEIQNNGKTLQIQTNRKDNFQYIWLETDDLEIIAEFSEHI